jgi:hypothetical protein
MGRKIMAVTSCISAAGVAYFFFPEAVVMHAGTSHELRDTLQLLSSALTAVGGIGVSVEAWRG